MLFTPADVSAAKPGGRAGRISAGRPGGGAVIKAKTVVTPKTIVAPKSIVKTTAAVKSKTVVAAKTIVKSKTLVATKTLALKPAVVKGLGGKAIKTSLYASKFGFKTKGGFVAYRGLKHGHWTRKWFCGARRCWMWYCPSACCWYYWSGASGCYMPINYLPDYPPTVVNGGVEPVLPPGAENVPAATGDEVPNVPASNTVNTNKANGNKANGNKANTNKANGNAPVAVNEAE
jgi:hypothetical protein